MHWPKGIEAKGELRQQFCHVIDVAPTVLEAAGIPEPTMVNGVTQSPYEGTSMLYSFEAPEAPERHDLQYFEIFGNRGIYFKGWSAVTKHRTPWGQQAPPAFDDDVWELYDGTKDYSQAHDLSKEMPEKLHELQRLWLDRSDQVQRHPARRPFRRALQPRHRRAAPADQGRHPGVLPRHDPPLREQRPEHKEQVVLGDGRGRRARAEANGTSL